MKLGMDPDREERNAFLIGLAKKSQQLLSCALPGMAINRICEKVLTPRDIHPSDEVKRHLSLTGERQKEFHGFVGLFSLCYLFVLLPLFLCWLCPLQISCPIRVFCQWCTVSSQPYQEPKTSAKISRQPSISPRCFRWQFCTTPIFTMRRRICVAFMEILPSKTRSAPRVRAPVQPALRRPSRVRAAAGAAAASPSGHRRRRRRRPERPPLPPPPPPQTSGRRAARTRSVKQRRQ
jgi:hypothetical protein